MLNQLQTYRVNIKSYLNKIVSTEKLDSITQSSLDKIDKQFDNVIEGFGKYDKYEDKINSIINKIK